MTYISSGTFENDLISLFGPLNNKKTATQIDLDNERFGFDEALKTEISAFYALDNRVEIPELSWLKLSITHDDDEFFEDLAAYIDDEDGEVDFEPALFLESIQFWHKTGEPFFRVHKHGVYVAFGIADAFEIDPIGHPFEDFLKFLVRLEAARQGKARLSDVKKEFGSLFEDAGHFFEQAIEQAEEQESNHL